LADPVFVGVDVSKSWVDFADTKGRKARVANEYSALKAVLAGPWGTCANMVCEATGGYERVLMRVASARQPPGSPGPIPWTRERCPNSPPSPSMSRGRRCRIREPKNSPTWSAVSPS
jgi:hypothetical protein